MLKLQALRALCITTQTLFIGQFILNSSGAWCLLAAYPCVFSKSVREGEKAER